MQYTRIYLDGTGTIIHVHTQMSTILIEPIEQPSIAESWDLELDDLTYSEAQLTAALESRGRSAADATKLIQDLKNELGINEARELALKDPRLSNLFVVRSASGLVGWEFRRARELLTAMEKRSGQPPRFKAGTARATPIRKATKRR